MLYPSIGQYTEAIKLAAEAPEDYFATLTTLRAVLDGNGNPVMSSGNFAVVFKMQDTDGKIFALKCFTRDQEGRNESYRLIADELKDVSSPYITNIQYLENEFFVDTGTDDTEFPVLLMDWVEGETLDKYIKNHISEPLCLEMLACDFAYLADWLLKQPFAHGDLKPDNILVKDDGSLVLIDYDGMYVPKMRGQKARELGSPDFRHPQRTEDDFDEHIDDFAVVTILLSIKALSLNNNLLDTLNAKDCVLLHTQDFSNLAQSAANQKLQELIYDKIFARIYAMFVVVLAEKVMDEDEKNNLSKIFNSLINGVRQKKDEFSKIELSTEVTDEEIKDGVEDEFGVVYSRDGKRLLTSPFSLTECVIRKGTIVICNYAFYSRWHLTSIQIPDGVTIIGDEAFCNCHTLTLINIPDSVTMIGNGAFSGCCSLTSFKIPESVSSINEGTFGDCSFSSIVIPKSVTKIKKMAFSLCSNLVSINIPDSVIEFGQGVFLGCERLSRIYIPLGTRNKYEELLPKFRDALIE